MSFHRHLHEAEILLQNEGESLDALVTEVLDHLCQCAKLEAHEAEQARAWVASNGVSQPRDLGRSVGVLRIRALDSAAEPRVALVRVPHGVEASDHEEVHFLWIVLGPRGVTAPPDDELEPFGWMLHDDRFNTSLLGAQDPHEVLSAYERYLDFVEAPPETTLPVELERSGRLFGALRHDIARRAPHVGDDWRSGIHPKALASILFLFFACLAPSVAFGGLLGQLTGGQQGAVEAIIATGVGGCLYALFSGQPLTLIGSTGPIIIFLGTLYHLSVRLGVPYLPSMFWVGMWTSAFLVLVVAFDGASLIGWFTRFTDDVFAGLISLIFITSAVTSIFGGLVVDVPTSGELLSLLLALGTFIIAQQLSRARRSPLLLAPVREFLADFGPAIAITAMTGLALTMTEIDIPHLAVPDEIAPTTARSWWVDPWQAPTWVRYGAALPALLGCVLIYLDQNITVRLVNAPEGRGLPPRPLGGRAPRRALLGLRFALGGGRHRALVEPRAQLGRRRGAW